MDRETPITQEWMLRKFGHLAAWDCPKCGYPVSPQATHLCPKDYPEHFAGWVFPDGSRNPEAKTQS